MEIERKYLIRYPDLAYLDSVCTNKVEMVQTSLQGGSSGLVGGLLTTAFDELVKSRHLISPFF